MLDEAPECRGLEFGAGLVVHRNLLLACPTLCSAATASVEALPALRRSAPANLVHRQIFLVRGDEPAITERVLDPADAIAVELVGHRPDELCPRRHGALDRAVDVLDIKMDRDRRPADGLRAQRLDLGVLVGQHDAGIADADLGVVDLAAGIRQAHDLLGAERSLVEGDGVARTTQDQIRRHTVIALGNRFYLGAHPGLASVSLLGKRPPSHGMPAALFYPRGLPGATERTPGRPALRVVPGGG